MRIFKYKYSTTVEMPINAKILNVDIIDGIGYIWALIDESSYLIERRFEVFFTGEMVESENKLKHLKTIVSESGLVAHFFEAIIH